MIQAIWDFFAGQSALANAFGIITGFLTLFGIPISIYSYFSGKMKWSGLTAWSEERYGPGGKKLNPASKASISIAIVDDQPEHFPIQFSRNLGYNIDVLTSVSLADAAKLQRLDLVVLDISGVVAEDKVAGGLELLKIIKSHSPSPLIIAASAKKWDPTVIDFFRLADKNIKKPIKEADFSQCLESLLVMRATPVGVASLIESEVNNLPEDGAKKAKTSKKIIKTLLAGGRNLPAGYISDSARQARIEQLMQTFQRFARYYDVR